MAAIHKTLIVSPHIDDAFLDLGGYILARQSSEVIEIINVFSYDPWVLGEQGSKPARINTRKKEELQNASKSGTKIYFWDFPAAWKERGYRHWSDPIDEDKDRKLIGVVKDKLIKEIFAGKFERIFYPIGIGGHVDHEIMHRIGIELSDYFKGVQTLFYEDLPYALDQNFWRTAQKFFNLTNLKFNPIDFSTLLERKRSLLESYKSQLTLEEVDAVMEYAINPYKFMPEKIRHIIKGEHPNATERLWFVSDSF